MIEPSLYERCSLVNEENVTLINYAAFFSSVKCFKYLLMNGTSLENTGKYAIAGGNEEIIHLCEQNHSSFEGAYEIAIMFHRNDIFHYIYENKLKEINNLEELGKHCILYHNFEIFSFLVKEGMKTNDDFINEAAIIGNIFLVEYFLKEHAIPHDTLLFPSGSGNIELVEYVLKQEGIDINTKGTYTYYMIIFQNNIWKLFKLFQTALIKASSNGHTEIVKLLLEQEGIDINTKDKIYFNNLIFQNNIWKLLMGQLHNYRPIPIIFKFHVKYADHHSGCACKNLLFKFVGVKHF